MQTATKQPPIPPNGPPTIHVDATIVRTSTLIVAAVAIAIWALLNSFFAIGLDDSDRDGWHRSGATVVTDHRTGLQYLSPRGGGITPRLDEHGRQMRTR